MSHPTKSASYNLKVVLQLTGIKPDTLRAWERRYGLPQPQRTPGGHRLYSQYDIEMIKWLMARQEEGMRINRAIDLWRALVSDGLDPLDGENSIKGTAPSLEQPLVVGSSLDELRLGWVGACLAFDEISAERILIQSFAMYPVEMVCLEVLQKGIVDIGDRWYRGLATVQQEHFASGLALRRLDALIAASPPSSRSEKILVGCPAMEEHTMAPLMTTLFLRRHGWDAIYLGANVPQLDLDKAVSHTGARLVILIASQLYTAANLFDSAHQLKRFNMPFAYAGSIFARQPRLRKRIPGYYLGDRLDRVVQEVDIALNLPLHFSDTPVAQEEFSIARKEIEANQSMIKADVWNQLQAKEIKNQTLQLATDLLMRDILSALKLESLESLQVELDWVNVLLDHQEYSASLLPLLLRVFAHALDRNVGDAGKIVVDWLLIEADRLGEM